MVTPLGNDNQTTIIGAGQGIDGASTSLLEVVVVDPKGMKVAPDGAMVNTENIIGVEMGDLSEKDRDEIERELQRKLEEVMVERRRKKLACFQTTRGRVIKKGDTMEASVPVNSPFTLEELVHMIDVSVNSKYGADLEGSHAPSWMACEGRLNLFVRSLNKSVITYQGKSGLWCNRF
jgi:hypothetical protein